MFQYQIVQDKVVHIPIGTISKSVHFSNVQPRVLVDHSFTFMKLYYFQLQKLCCLNDYFACFKFFVNSAIGSSKSDLKISEIVTLNSLCKEMKVCSDSTTLSDKIVG